VLILLCSEVLPEEIPHVAEYDENQVTEESRPDVVKGRFVFDGVGEFYPFWKLGDIFMTGMT
jgi:hypothetical protein